MMIAGGGTGGHIYPAISIGRALQKLNTNVEVSFIGTKEGLESKIMQREHLKLYLIQSGKLNFSGNLVKKIKTLVRLPIGLIQSIFLILKHRPHFVLGVGGYASAPFLLASVILRKNSAIWEPNAHPGLANRWLSGLVQQAYLVFEESKQYMKSKKFKVFGMPLRDEIEKAKNTVGASSDKLRILCFGGSQGSVFLNNQISNFLIQNPELHEQIYLYHQTGSLDFERMKKKYTSLSCVEVHEYIYDMPRFYQNTDVMFCRGGASTIAEAAAFGIVPLIVPLPAADNHQMRNAEVVVKNNAGYLFEQNNFDDNLFSEKIKLLLKDLPLRKEMSLNLKKLSSGAAAVDIAEHILSQIKY